MKNLLIPFALIAAFSIPTALFADTIVFASFSGLGDGNAQANTTLNMQVGDTGSGSIWIFTDEDDIDVAAAGSLLLSNSSTVAFTGTTVVNPVIDNVAFTTRWSDVDSGNISSNGNAIANMSGFAGTTDTPGIRLALGIDDPGPTIDDSGFDNSVGTMSYLYSTFTFEAIGLGTVDLNPDSFLLSSSGLVDFTTANATINVAPIPEPGSAIALALVGCVASCFRRRRSR